MDDFSLARPAGHLIMGDGSGPDGLAKKDGAKALSGAESVDTATTQLDKPSRTKNLRIEYQHAEALLSPFMPCGVTCLDDFLRTVRGKALKGGSSVVVQPHGRHGHDTPHLHIIATSGGGDAQAHTWVHVGSLPDPMLHKTWQRYALERCREAWKTDAMARLVQACYDKYPNGFVANVPKGDGPSRSQSLATY